METFIKERAFMLQEKINKRFSVVKFNLFKEQINGGVRQTCECIVNGIPYILNANRESQINGGIDIVDKIQGHYNLRMPIIVDNAEAVTEMYKIDTQLIKLIKPEIDESMFSNYDDFEYFKKYYSEIKTERIALK